MDAEQDHQRKGNVNPQRNFRFGIAAIPTGGLDAVINFQQYRSLLQKRTAISGKGGHSKDTLKRHHLIWICDDKSFVDHRAYL